MGRNKALLEWDGRPLIAVVAERLRIVADEIIVAANDTHLYAPFANRCVADIFPGVGTLGGLHAGLRASSYDLALVVGCDMPFLNPTVMAWFVEAAAEVDAVVLRQGKWLKPSSAASDVYKRQVHSLSMTRYGCAMLPRPRSPIWMRNCAPSAISTPLRSGARLWPS